MGDHAAQQGGLTEAAPPGLGTADPEAPDLEAGRLLFAKPCEFTAGAATEDALPPDALPEIAFAGRSNVGKSSLVNALTGRKTLARVSHTPGRTRQLNFFDLGGRLTLVDLPGYGYAEAPKGEVAGWTRLVELYLKGRARLRRALVLIDARHGIKPPDRPVMTMLDEAAVSWQVVLTKGDKVRPAELGRVIARVRDELRTHVAAHPDLAVTSAHEATGIAELRGALALLAEPAPARYSREP